MVDPLRVLIVGTGEYTTGYVHGQSADSDKRAGIIGLVLFDLRRRGAVAQDLGIVGTTGRKFAGIRAHLARNIGNVYNGLDTSLRTWPADDVERDAQAYLLAMREYPPGSAVAIFTPDDTHFAIALAALERGLHVMLSKPAVKTLAEHDLLVRKAREMNVVCAVELHKRWDPMYSDARERIRKLGRFNYFYAYMSQPKKQLDTFRAWAGKSSDIMYYLSTHHIDFHCWSMEGIAKPLRVLAMKSTGVATGAPYYCDANTEDTITLTVEWQNLVDGSLGHAVYTSSWTAANRAEVHSQQRFHYLGEKGEVRIDQAHRGYELTTDADGFANINPLFMRYTPDSAGNFAGHRCYGYLPTADWVDVCRRVNAGEITVEQGRGQVAALGDNRQVTAILEAGRRSLDGGGVSIYISSEESFSS